MGRIEKEGFVQRSTLRWESLRRDVRLAGQIACQGNIVLTIEKILEVTFDDKDVEYWETTDYSYNASVAGHDNILRYDNAEHHGLESPHHKHLFNWKTGKPLHRPTHVGLDWPTLGEFIREVHSWHDANVDVLPVGVATIVDLYVARAMGDDEDGNDDDG